MDDLKIWCSFGKKEEERVIIPKADEVRIFTILTEDYELLTIEQFMFDLEYVKDLISYSERGREQNGNYNAEWDGNDVSISNRGDGNTEGSC
jgi:hypothetical protein